MYTYEERVKAVKLYIQYDFSLSSVTHELGYLQSLIHNFFKRESIFISILLSHKTMFKCILYHFFMNLLCVFCRACPIHRTHYTISMILKQFKRISSYHPHGDFDQFRMCVF